MFTNHGNFRSCLKIRHRRRSNLGPPGATQQIKDIAKSLCDVGISHGDVRACTTHKSKNRDGFGRKTCTAR